MGTADHDHEGAMPGHAAPGARFAMKQRDDQRSAGAAALLIVIVIVIVFLFSFPRNKRNGPPGFPDGQKGAIGFLVVE